MFFVLINYCFSPIKLMDKFSPSPIVNTILILIAVPLVNIVVALTLSVSKCVFADKEILYCGQPIGILVGSDENKLNDVSKIKLAAMKSGEVYDRLTAWAKEFDSEFYQLLTRDPEFTKAMLAIDRDDAKKPRKDLAKWSEAKEYFAFFFEPLYTPCHTLPENIAAEDAKAFLSEYKKVYDAADDRQAWFEKIKLVAPQLNFAAETKEYKANPENYKGSAGDLSTVLRIAVTGRTNTPDLCSIMQVLGREECFKRIDKMIEVL